MKKFLAAALACTTGIALLSGCGTATSSSSSDGATTETSATFSSGLSMSWWGGDSRHEAYQNALAAFT